MAKAREIPGLTAGLPFGEAAARSVAVRTDELFAPCFPKAELRPVLREVKALAAALGSRRDPDVELLALQEFLRTAAPDERVGVERFVARTRAQQEQGNAILAAELCRMDEMDLRGRLTALAEQAIR